MDRRHPAVAKARSDARHDPSMPPYDIHLAKSLVQELGITIMSKAPSDPPF